MRQYLATALLVVIGLMAYGCGDSGSVDPGPQLTSLSVSGATLQPSFNSETTQYSVQLSSNTQSATLSATKSEPNDVLSGAVTSPAGQATGQATIQAPAQGSTKDVTMTVSASDGRAKTYTVTLARVAPPPLSLINNLQNLTVLPGTLSPNFDRDRTRTDYAVNDVSSSATSILVTATPQDSSATVMINGQGGNSRSISLPTGPSRTEIDILVRAPNGQGKPYLIIVNQPAPAAPPAPTSAPDLISADDSCLLIPNTNNCDPNSGTSRTDNITNDPTPRFTIPKPAAGQTPSLYKATAGGSPAKVQDAVFGSATNTFTLTTPLTDGVYTITYTLTNAGGESPQSLQALTVTINTGTPPPPGGGPGPGGPGSGGPGPGDQGAQ